MREGLCCFQLPYRQLPNSARLQRLHVLQKSIDFQTFWVFHSCDSGHLAYSSEFIQVCLHAGVFVCVSMHMYICRDQGTTLAVFPQMLATFLSGIGLLMVGVL